MRCGHFYNLKLSYLKHLVYGVGHVMKLCRGLWEQVNKIKILENYNNVDDAYFTR